MCTKDNNVIGTGNGNVHSRYFSGSRSKRHKAVGVSAVKEEAELTPRTVVEVMVVARTETEVVVVATATAIVAVATTAVATR
jgi:hypothetical protein